MSATASRYECLLRHERGAGLVHDSGTGKPKRKRCRCGGEFFTLAGWWGVFRWTGTGNYRLTDALSVHRSDAIADRARAKADPHGETLVVRWVSVPNTREVAHA